MGTMAAVLKSTTASMHSIQQTIDSQSGALAVDVHHACLEGLQSFSAFQAGNLDRNSQRETLHIAEIARLQETISILKDAHKDEVANLWLVFGAVSLIMFVVVLIVVLLAGRSLKKML